MCTLDKPLTSSFYLSSQGIPAEESHTSAEPVAPAGGGTPAVSTGGLTSPTSTAPSQPVAGSGGETEAFCHDIVPLFFFAALYY